MLPLTAVVAALAPPDRGLRAGGNGDAGDGAGSAATPACGRPDAAVPEPGDQGSLPGRMWRGRLEGAPPKTVPIGESVRSSGVTVHRTTHQTERVSSRTRDRFKLWFWRRPRAHGDTILDRRVSPLESLYDLVYAVVISQAALPLEQHVSVRRAVEFAVVFALIWIAWTNGSLYLELHGREDGRTRAFVFIQIGVLALVAVFAANAAGTGGPAFALAYAAFLVVMTWLWYTVQRQDRVERPEFVSVTARYLNGLVLSVAVMLVSAVLPVVPRLITWSALAVASIMLVLFVSRTETGEILGIPPTESLVERFGLFTIIVLGGVVFGVVAGLSAAEHD